MTALELPPGSERHFALRIGTGELRFIQRPISTPAPEGTIAWLDGVTEKGNPGRCVGVYRDGAWCNDRGGPNLRIKPLTWTVCADIDAKAGGAVDVG